jgi:hypothetical protein
MLLEAPALPPRPASNSLVPDAVARLVSAATVEATPAAEFAVEADAVLDVLNTLEMAEAWPPPMLAIDIMTSIAIAVTSLDRQAG